MSTSNMTIVSSFISNVNSHRSLEKYIEYGEHLLCINIPKIIFIEQEVFQQYLSHKEYPNTKFVIIKRTDLYLYQYLDKLDQFYVLYNPEKNTLEYILTICGKNEWMRHAIEIDPFHTSQFIWIDFGIYHIVDDAELFKRLIYDLNSKSYDKIRIASCWDPTKEKKELDIYRVIRWYFAGGIFGGSKEKLIEFADLTKKKCLYMIHTYHHIMWEVNIWFLIFKEQPELFDWYLTDHNPSMIQYY